MKTSVRAGWYAVACLCAALTGGCASKQQASTTQTGEPLAAAAVDRRSLPLVPLPDLSSATRVTAQQLRDRHAVLERGIDDPATPAGDLASAYGEMGMLLMAAEYLDSAEPCFFNAQALAPRDMRWPYYLGHLYRLRGETAKSVTAFERAQQLRPDDKGTLVWLGRAYLDEGRLEAAEPLFSKVLSVEPQAGPALYGLGRVALASRDYERAVKYLEQTLSLNPKASIVHYPLAMAYRGLGRLPEASIHLRATGNIEVAWSDPLMEQLTGSVKSEFLYENLGIRALDEGEPEAAAGYFRQALVLAPDDASVRQRLGTALALQGDGPGAVKELQEVLRRSPRFASAHYALGLLIASSGRYQEAIEQFSAAVKSNPAYVEARLQLANVLRRTGRQVESLPQYEQVARLDPRVADAALGYAMALAGLNRYQESRNRLIEDMKIYPGRPDFAHGLVRLQAAAPDDRVRDGRQAIALAQSLIAREPPNPDLGEAMAMALAETGQYDEAATWQRQAMALATRSGRVGLSRRMADNLALYEHHQPSRRPWRDDDPVGPSDAAGSAAR